MKQSTDTFVSGFSRETPMLVAGGGGFIGGWLTRTLREEGYTNITAVDVKPLSEWFQLFPDVHSEVADLQRLDDCQSVVPDESVVFNLAADMGGMGFIENNKAACMLSVLPTTNQSGRAAGRDRVSGTV